MAQNLPMAGQQPVKVNLATMPDITCGAIPANQAYGSSPIGGEDCQSTEFTKVFMFKKISALVSPNGREQVIQLEVLKCLKCGAVKVLRV